jgi:hypothetical protein
MRQQTSDNRTRTEARAVKAAAEARRQEAIAISERIAAQAEVEQLRQELAKCQTQ